jgi:alkylated DNA repair dioxygenase AlkB
MEKFQMKETTELADGGVIDYYQNFFGLVADELFKRIKEETPWRQEKGKFAPFPRLTMWYADPGLTYTYSGVTHQAEPWTPLLSEIRNLIQDVAKAPFNSLLLNYYRTGKDSISWHTDAEPELGINPIVPSVSLGAEREFQIKHLTTKEVKKFTLAHGSVLIMGGTMQHHWLHSVPKTKEEIGERINLTFRQILK